MGINSVAAWIIHSLLMIWFFRCFYESFSKVFNWQSLIPFATFFIYVAPTPESLSVITYAYRFFICCMYIMTSFKLKLPRSLYFSAIFCNALITVQMINPLIRSAVPDLPGQLIMIFFWILLIAAMTFVSAFVCFKKIIKIGTARAVGMAVLTLLLLYCKSTSIPFYTENGSTNIYLLIVMILALVLLAFADRLIVSAEEQKRLEILNAIAESNYNSLRAQVDSDKNVRQLYHDMKNHLDVLARTSSDQQRSYIDHIRSELEEYQEVPDSGNETFNALLSSKMPSLKKLGIRLVLSLDLSSLSFVEPPDIVAIFGNAVDNAIEASEKIPDTEDRFIRITSERFADQLIIRVMNRCAVAPIFVDGLPSTTKQDKRMHGFGSANMRRCAAKYSGTVSSEVSDGVFYLTVMLPITK